MMLVFKEKGKLLKSPLHKSLSNFLAMLLKPNLQFIHVRVPFFIGTSINDFFPQNLKNPLVIGTSFAPLLTYLDYKVLN